jgi:hypothetical protein
MAQEKLMSDNKQEALVVLPAEYSITKITTMPTSELRGLIRKFGASAVNDRLFSRS